MIYIIDLYEAREYCFISDYKNMMNRYLPKGEQFIHKYSIELLRDVVFPIRNKKREVNIY